MHIVQGIGNIHQLIHLPFLITNLLDNLKMYISFILNHSLYDAQFFLEIHAIPIHCTSVICMLSPNRVYTQEFQLARSLPTTMLGLHTS